MKIEEIKKDRINELHDLLAELAAIITLFQPISKGIFQGVPLEMY